MEIKDASHAMNDMTNTVAAVCINGLSMFAFIAMFVWAINKLMEIMFGVALIPAR